MCAGIQFMCIHVFVSLFVNYLFVCLRPSSTIDFKLMAYCNKNNYYHYILLLLLFDTTLKTRLGITLSDTRLQLVRQAGIATRTGRKWSASLAVDQAESRLKHRDIGGMDL